MKSVTFVLVWGDILTYSRLTMLWNVNALLLSPGLAHITPGSFHVLYIKRRGGNRKGGKCIWNNKTPRQINSTAFPWQHAAVIWRLVSHGCVSLPHRPPLCLTDGSCDCNHPSYCQRQKKRARKGKSRTPSPSRSLVSSKQATPLWLEPTHGPHALCNGCVCVCVFVLIWSMERTCVGVHLWLPVPAHYTAWSVTGVYTGELWTCLILQLIKSTRDSFPCGRASGPHINMSLFSRQEKQEERNRRRRRRRRWWRRREEDRNRQAERRWKSAQRGQSGIYDNDT